jgi:hypothetical protein
LVHAECPKQYRVTELARCRVARAAERDRTNMALRDSASARVTAALALAYSTGSPGATPSSADTNGIATK